MIMSKIIKNQIKKLVKELVGTDNNNKWELRKIENELRSQSSKMSRMDKRLEQVENKIKDA